jgi:basic membrane protein A
MKRLMIALVIALLSLGAIAFSDDPLTVGYIHDSEEGPFTVMTREGLAMAHEDYGDEFTEKEYFCASPDEYYAQIELAAQENDMVIAVGFSFDESVRQFAPLYSDVKFVCLDFVSRDGSENEIISNTHPYIFKEHEGSFLVGIAAGIESKKNVVGFIGGMDFYLINKFKCGYIAGVRTSNFTTETVVDYADSFAAPHSGFYYATRQHELNSADIIFSAAGGTGHGVIESAEIFNYNVIGVDYDQSGESPNHVLCSMIKKINLATYLAVQSLVEDTFVGGEESILGIAEGGVDYSDNAENLKPKTITAIEKVKQDIIDEIIIVPENIEQLEIYLNDL